MSMLRKVELRKQKLSIPCVKSHTYICSEQSKCTVQSNVEGNTPMCHSHVAGALNASASWPMSVHRAVGEFWRCQPHKQFAEALGEGNIWVCSTLMCPFNRKPQCTCVAMRSAGLQMLVLCTWLYQQQVASRAVMCFLNTTMQRHQSLVLGKCCKHFLTTEWRLFIYKKRQSNNVAKKLSCRYAFCHSGLRLSAPGKRSVQSLPL